MARVAGVTVSKQSADLEDMPGKSVSPGADGVLACCRSEGRSAKCAKTAPRQPTMAQRKWLQRGLASVDGRLPLFDNKGRLVNSKMIDACRRQGWSEQWFQTKNAPGWQVHRLTRMGRKALG